MGSGASGLEGRASDGAAAALLIVDAINEYSFEDARRVLESARPMAESIRRLKQRARRAGLPIIYVNDNFGRWRSDFRALVERCARPRARGRDVVAMLRPSRLDYFVLKPRHSGFFSTTLDLLLQHLGARTLLLTGLLADMCILFTAQDAYMRGYEVIVPPDCVAARTAADHARTLAHMRRALGAATPPSGDLDLEALSRRRGPAERPGARAGAARRAPPSLADAASGLAAGAG